MRDWLKCWKFSTFTTAFLCGDDDVVKQSWILPRQALDLISVNWAASVRTHKNYHTTIFQTSNELFVLRQQGIWRRWTVSSSRMTLDVQHLMPIQAHHQLSTELHSLSRWCDQCSSKGLIPSFLHWARGCSPNPRCLRCHCSRSCTCCASCSWTNHHRPNTGGLRNSWTNHRSNTGGLRNSWTNHRSGTGCLRNGWTNHRSNTGCRYQGSWTNHRPNAGCRYQNSSSTWHWICPNTWWICGLFLFRLRRNPNNFCKLWVSLTVLNVRLIWMSKKRPVPVWQNATLAPLMLIFGLLKTPENNLVPSISSRTALESLPTPLLFANLLKSVHQIRSCSEYTLYASTISEHRLLLTGNKDVQMSSTLWAEYAQMTHSFHHFWIVFMDSPSLCLGLHSKIPKECPRSTGCLTYQAN